MSARLACFASLAIGPLCFFAAAEGMPSLHGSAATAYLKKEGVYNSLSEAVQAAMYGAHPDKLGFAAPNPEQDFVARFSDAGLKIDGVGWKTSWRLRSVGYGERQVAVGPARIEAHGIHIELRRGEGVTEWYVNGSRGLEQGFTLQRPSFERRAGERFRLTIEVEGDLKAREAGEAVELLRADGSVALHYQHLVVKDAKGRTLGARMGVAESAVWVEVEDAGAAWPVTVDPTFAQQAYLKASTNTGASYAFGNSVAVSGGTVVVGAPGESSSARGVNGNQTDNSAPSSGAAYVFARKGGEWTQEAYLKASNNNAGDYLGFFGFSVAVSGDTLVVGAIGEDSSATGVNGNQTDNGAANSGAAYVFFRRKFHLGLFSSATIVEWSQEAYLKASNSDGGDQFGFSVAVSGDTVVVGARQEASSSTGVDGDQSNNSAFQSGAAYVFARNGTTWSQQAYLKASNTGAQDVFGYSVAVSGDTIVVGAQAEDSNATGANGDETNNSLENSGATYVFTRNGGTWSQQAYLKASNAGVGDLFGKSVAVSGNTVVVGALNGNQGDNSVVNSGAAYVFVRNGGTWSQQAYLKASNPGFYNGFGTSVAVAGGLVVVGAASEDNSGAAYVFVRSGVTWSQQDYLKASNAGPLDLFGASVAVSNATVVVGAYGEGSNATGVNGDQSNNALMFAGAAYVFYDPSVRITDIRSITDFGDVPDFTSGSWLQITGANLAQTTRIWQWSDFNGSNAPASLDGVSVLFNGAPGFISFTKPDDDFGPSQINVQAPAGPATGPMPVVVTNSQGISNTFITQKAPLAPGMLAPPKFNVGGKQYLVATYGTDYFFVGNENLLPGAPFRPAKPGDILYLYGVGFGDVTANIPPGVIPTVLTQLNAQVKFQFGPALVTPYYAGFYPNYIGLDLFGVVVPDVPDGDHLITVLVNGQPLTQVLYLTVKR